MDESIVACDTAALVFASQHKPRALHYEYTISQAYSTQQETIFYIQNIQPHNNKLVSLSLNLLFRTRSLRSSLSVLPLIVFFLLSNVRVSLSYVVVDAAAGTQIVITKFKIVYLYVRAAVPHI